MDIYGWSLSHRSTLCTKSNLLCDFIISKDRDISQVKIFFLTYLALPYPWLILYPHIHSKKKKRHTKYFWGKKEPHIRKKNNPPTTLILLSLEYLQAPWISQVVNIKPGVPVGWLIQTSVDTLSSLSPLTNFFYFILPQVWHKSLSTQRPCEKSSESNNTLLNKTYTQNIPLGDGATF